MCVCDLVRTYMAQPGRWRTERLCAWAPGGRPPGNDTLLNYFKVYIVPHSARVSGSLSIFPRSIVESNYNILKTIWAESLAISPPRKGPRVNTQHLRLPREGKCCEGLSNFCFKFMLAHILNLTLCHIQFQDTCGYFLLSKYYLDLPGDKKLI